MDIEHLFATPDRYLWRFEGHQGVFADMDRESYRRSIFTDDRLAPKSQALEHATLDRLVAYSEASAHLPQTRGFIFHMAYCGSTLLARGLDMPEANIVYREPFTLRQLGVKAVAAPGRLGVNDDWLKMLRLATVMYGKTYRPEHVSVVKANVPVNFIIPEIFQVAPQARAIFLHPELDDFVLSVLKSPERVNWLRLVSQELKHDIVATVGLDLADFEQLSPAQTAACLWACQKMLFQAALSAGLACRSLPAETFFTQPAEVLGAASHYFGQKIDAARIAAITSGDVFATSAKNPQQAYSNAQRLELRASLRTKLAQDLAAAHAWLDRQVGEQVLLPLAAPLMEV